MEKINKTIQFVSEARQELRKVVWPARQQAISSTWVVIVMVFLISMFLGLVDFALSKLVRYVLN